MTKLKVEFGQGYRNRNKNRHRARDELGGKGIESGLHIMNRNLLCPLLSLQKLS